MVTMSNRYKPLARGLKKKENAQMTNIRTERGDIITDFTDIKKIIKGYYE